MAPFTPDTLPLTCIEWERHVTNIGQAHAELARYDGMLQTIVNPAVLLSPITIQEAVLSSRIEGTQASMEDVLEFEADPTNKIEPSRRADIQEITNYRDAIHLAVVQLERRPISLNLIRDLHAKLLDSVRGRDKAAGQFRRTQNYIAPPGHPIEEASYIPPEWPQVEPAMQNWELYVHADEKDALVQLAIVKAQFEIIHPFLDGNGRLGRMLVPLFLFEKGLLSSPMFYLSAYLEKHRKQYYYQLRAITEERDWNGWIEFFLYAIVEQATANASRTREIIDLYESTKQEVPQIIHSQYAIQAIDALFDRPIFGRSDFVRRSGIPTDTAFRILRLLMKEGIIQQSRPNRGSQPAIITFPPLLRIIS